MSERNESSSGKNPTRYIAFGVCFGLLVGAAIGVIASVLTGSVALVLPLASGIGLVAGILVALYLANKSNA